MERKEEIQLLLILNILSKQQKQKTMKTLISKCLISFYKKINSQNSQIFNFHKISNKCQIYQITILVIKIKDINLRLIWKIKTILIHFFLLTFKFLKSNISLKNLDHK